MMDRIERIAWRNAILCGLLWGLAVTLAITLNQPIGDLSLHDWETFTLSLATTWCSTGLVWGVGVKMAEGSSHRLWRLAVVLATAVAVSTGVHSLPIPGADREATALGRLVQNVPLGDLLAYHLWVNLFYGGLYAVGYHSTRRTLELRRRLADLRLVRNEAETVLRETRLRAVRGHIQPAMLLEALEALSRAFAQDAEVVDRLFDLLITFLRAAMPGLRSGASTLAAELNVLSCYARLRSALGASSPAWRLNLIDPPSDIAFPPLRLLPALDQISRAVPLNAAATVEVTASPGPQIFVLRIAALAARPFPPSLMRRLREQLARDLGGGVAVTAGLGDAVVAELRFKSAGINLIASAAAE